MLYAVKITDDLERLEELASLQNQRKAMRLQDMLGKQNFHADMKKVFETVTKSLAITSQDITKTITEASFQNNLAIENLNIKLLEIMNDRCMIASYFLSPLAKVTNPENSTHFKLVKDSSSNRVNDLLIHNTLPITLHDNLITFRDSGKVFELKGYLLEMITNKNYNVDLAKLSDKKLMYDFAKEKNFDMKTIGKKSTRNKTLINLLKSPGLIIYASGISNIIFLSSAPNELCDKIKLLLQQKQAGNNSDRIIQEIVAIVDKLLENKGISKKQHKQLLIKSNLI